MEASREMARQSKDNSIYREKSLLSLCLIFNQNPSNKTYLIEDKEVGTHMKLPMILQGFDCHSRFLYGK